MATNTELEIEVARLREALTHLGKAVAFLLTLQVHAKFGNEGLREVNEEVRESQERKRFFEFCESMGITVVEI